MLLINGTFAQITTQPTSKPTTAPILREITSLRGPGGEFVKYSSDGSRLVTGSSTAFEEASFRVWKTANFKEIPDLIMHRDLKRVDITSDGSKVLSVAYCQENKDKGWETTSGEAILWDCDTGRQLLPPITHKTKMLQDAALSLDGMWIATAGNDDVVRVWSAKTGTAVFKVDLGLPISTVQFNRSGSQIIAHGDRIVAVIDVKTGKVQHKWTGDLLQFQRFPPKLNQDGKLIAASEMYHVRVYDADSGKEVTDISVSIGDSAAVFGIGMSRDGKYFATTGFGYGGGAIWEIATGKMVFSDNDIALGGDAEFSPDGRLICFMDYGLWDIALRSRVELPKDIGWSRAKTFSPDGKFLAISVHSETCIYEIVRK